MSKKYDVAIVGATGAVGETLISILDQRNFPINNLYPLASKRSVGSKVRCQGKSWTVEELDTFDFSKVQIGVFSAGAYFSEISPPAENTPICTLEKSKVSSSSTVQDLP
jgi:aspartate-semialdehyde dehydrogenase